MLITLYLLGLIPNAVVCYIIESIEPTSDEREYLWVLILATLLWPLAVAVVGLICAGIAIHEYYLFLCRVKAHRNWVDEYKKGVK